MFATKGTKAQKIVRTYFELFVLLVAIRVSLETEASGAKTSIPASANTRVRADGPRTKGPADRFPGSGQSRTALSDVDREHLGPRGVHHDLSFGCRQDSSAHPPRSAGRGRLLADLSIHGSRLWPGH